jgi:uncharacterized membrane protein YdbT with pleckstrin-like domain
MTEQASPNNDSSQPAEMDMEWSYSGKAMRAQAILFWILTLAVTAGGLYATFTNLLGSFYFIVWCGIAAGLVLLWGYFYTIYFYRVWTIRYKLTDQRLYAYRGLLTRTSDSMELVYIEDVQLIQTLFDRLFNGGVGRLTIFCPSDRTDNKFILTGIDKPMEVFEKIDSARAAVRAKRSILTGG